MNDLIESDFLVYIGHVAVFYVPAHKLELVEFGEDGLTPKQMFESFLMEKFNAFSFNEHNTKGFWRQHPQAQIWVDNNGRYEVSFLGEEKVQGFVNFLSKMCGLLKEEAIYLVMGYKSWLVLPRNGDKDVV